MAGQTDLTQAAEGGTSGLDASRLSEAKLRPGNRKREGSPEAAARPDVLIIDDDPALREGLVELFRLEGRAAVVASTGSEALFLLEKGLDPGVILLDLDMPIMNGWDFIEAMRASPAKPVVPIIVMSGIASALEAPTREIDGGFFQKPLNFDRLLDAVDRFLGR